MATETVLMYNCSGPEWTKLRQIFLMFRVRIRPVEADQYGLTLAELLSRSGEKRGVEEDFSDPMVVFCGLSQGKLDQLLTAMALDRAAPGARGHGGPAGAEINSLSRRKRR